MPARCGPSVLLLWLLGVCSATRWKYLCSLLSLLLSARVGSDKSTLTTVQSALRLLSGTVYPTYYLQSPVSQIANSACIPGHVYFSIAPKAARGYRELTLLGPCIHPQRRAPVRSSAPAPLKKTCWGDKILEADYAGYERTSHWATRRNRYLYSTYYGYRVWKKLSRKTELALEPCMLNI